jgi:hypothetical protein
VPSQGATHPRLSPAACSPSCTRLHTPTRPHTRPHTHTHTHPHTQVANEIWEVKAGAVTRWRGDIVSYKAHLKATHEALEKRADLK